MTTEEIISYFIGFVVGLLITLLVIRRRNKEMETDVDRGEVHLTRFRNKTYATLSADKLSNIFREHNDAMRSVMETRQKQMDYISAYSDFIRAKTEKGVTLTTLVEAAESDWVKEHAEFLILVISGGAEKPEVIINSKENFEDKVGYIKTKYTEDLALGSTGISISNFYFVNEEGLRKFLGEKNEYL